MVNDVGVSPPEASDIAKDPPTVFRAGGNSGGFMQSVRKALFDLRRSFSLAPMLFAMQLRARRRANLLGWLWLLLPTALTLAIGMSLQRHGAFPLPRTHLPYAIYATIGVAMWQSLAEAASMPLRQLAMHRFSITRARMPLEAPVLAGLIEVASGALIRAAVLILILTVLGSASVTSLWALPFLLAALIAFPLAVGLVVAPVGMLVEDAGRALVVFLGIWLLLSPVAYPVADSVQLLNPAAPLLEGLRASLTGGTVPTSAFIASGLSLALLLPAWAWLRSSRTHLIDRVA